MHAIFRYTIKSRCVWELIAQWGPLPNHFNEPVLGAMMKAGEATIAIEEAEPGAFPICMNPVKRRLSSRMLSQGFGEINLDSTSMAIRRLFHNPILMRQAHVLDCYEHEPMSKDWSCPFDNRAECDLMDALGRCSHFTSGMEATLSKSSPSVLPSVSDYFRFNQVRKFAS